MCAYQGNSNPRYAITWDVIAYHLVHFVSIWVINKCQSSIDLFYKRARNITLILTHYQDILDPPLGIVGRLFE